LAWFLWRLSAILLIAASNQINGLLTGDIRARLRKLCEKNHLFIPWFSCLESLFEIKPSQSFHTAHRQK
jgi:hypothetical protein